MSNEALRAATPAPETQACICAEYPHVTYGCPAHDVNAGSSAPRDQWEAHPGMVTVYAEDGTYVGCMGTYRWQSLLREDGARCDVHPPARPVPGPETP